MIRGRPRIATIGLAALVGVLVLGACASTFRPFTARPITWRDGDLEAWGPRPAPRETSATWDAADGVFFRPQIRALSLPRATESVDVNAMDEVPDSSWFENRIGRRAMTPDEVARGACESVDTAPPTPWRVVEVKPDGVQPGFVIEDADGQRWILKTDSPRQPERATAADAVVAALLHAAGYHVPCNRVVFFSPADLHVDRETIGPEEMREVIAAARLPDGRLRAAVSRFVDGAPLGPWRFTGVWEEDVNDRVPHELRREVRGLRYFAAWVDHLDSRSHNTLAYWVGDEDSGHVRHALIDFGDSFGAVASNPRRNARLGHRLWVDPTAVVEDLFTLGIRPRPWYREPEPAHPVLGDYATEPFDPDGWRPNYWNGAFEDVDREDAAWAARILARFDRAHLLAAARQGRFSDPATAVTLADALFRRRDVILEAHLSRRSPLTAPRVDGRRLCVEDRAVTAGIRDAEDRTDAARARWLDGGAVVVRGARDGAALCVSLPARVGAYLVVDLRTETPGVDAPGPLRVHLAAERDGWRVIGLERPARGGAPSP